MKRRARANEYGSVAERIRAFYERHPDGAIQTEMVRLEGDVVIFRALVYRDPEDPHPTTGWAYEREGTGSARADAAAAGEARRGARASARSTGGLDFVEHCETCAIGRALANLNFAGARRPSREEMEKVARMQAVGAGVRSASRGGRVRAPTGVERAAAPRPDPAPASRERAPDTAAAGSAEMPEPGPDAATRIRDLLRVARLPRARRERIEALVAEEPEDSELREIEAYLLALGPGRGDRRRR